MIVDANVLLYAVDESSRFHESARAWLEVAMNGVERVGLPWVSLMAFQRIITHPRVTTTPLTAEEAWIHVTDWLDTEQAWVPTPGARHRDILGSLLIDGDLRGNFVTDAHLAALAIEHGVGICSYDSDFARFEGLRWLNPSGS
ncbi:MAG TPA: type II toxin-antitoxin system VapC family toxin [Marmoricola sp.]|nr:type II toxin-antitoxin system VapC family toxin [Nocardioidaceae bacterium]MCB8992974.1 type II toxin-antitoxin system VapC family toxin [Nocardioidaceae bacterium]HMU35937.1 type II toxin-antitoxin system VapC family toxin [Marmoricola sp.]HRV69670.1 type II toxin-antitoxin system VapC family toxin [Marmoricola sp.]